MQHSLSQRRTQCMLSPKGLPIFSTRHLFQLTQDQKGLFKACNGVECKGVPFFSKPWVRFNGGSREVRTLTSVQRSSQENQFDPWLITTRCKEFTYCLCNFIWPHRSHTFMFVRLRELFKSSILIGTKTQILQWNSHI
ncbi:hypothetical protein H5410_004860 [Solanum commersonii]|uniref:Uncharacterized protein n=1 Tax=Solanum commersonii TaxID=4109 RepID=A0A9J6A5J0_SOLCO|nr:hypothetical protein H5410_004860 [Solanum commersonii]